MVIAKATAATAQQATTFTESFSVGADTRWVLFSCIKKKASGSMSAAKRIKLSVLREKVTGGMMGETGIFVWGC